MVLGIFLKLFRLVGRDFFVSERLRIKQLLGDAGR